VPRECSPPSGPSTSSATSTSRRARRAMTAHSGQRRLSRASTQTPTSRPRNAPSDSRTQMGAARSPAGQEAHQGARQPAHADARVSHGDTLLDAVRHDRRNARSCGVGTSTHASVPDLRRDRPGSWSNRVYDGQRHCCAWPSQARAHGA
jgi:hypothetical protein